MSRKKKPECPACGADEGLIPWREGEKDSIKVPYVFEEIVVDASCTKCMTCGSEFFGSSRDRIVDKALEKAVAKSVHEMVIFLHSWKMRSVYLERVLSLPFGSINEFRDEARKGKTDPWKVALLRILCSFPWVAEVAGRGFQVSDPAVPTADYLRRRGWSVAVHNDYRLDGDSYTFWLFTKGDMAVKGEGRTDAEALAKAIAEATRVEQKEIG